MSTHFTKKILILSIFIPILSSILPIKAAKLYVTNRIPDIGFKIEIEADAGCGKVRWSSATASKIVHHAVETAHKAKEAMLGNKSAQIETNPLSGKLLQAHGTAFQVLDSCKDKPWQYIRLYVINKNNKRTEISIPIQFACVPLYCENPGSFCVTQNVYDRQGLARAGGSYGPLERRGCYEKYDPIIIFTKNSTGQVEVRRARIDYTDYRYGQVIWTRTFVDDVLVTTLNPADYE